MITDRDRLIQNEWFIPNKYADLGIMQKVYFKGRQYSYNIARKRMIEMIKEGYIKVHKDSKSNKNIYMLNEKEVRPPSEHRMIILSILAEMRYLGFDITTFEIEKVWLEEGSAKYISDGFTIFNVGKQRFHYFIEVQTSNNLCNLEKYDKLHDMGVVQKLYRDMGMRESEAFKLFPKRILLVSDRQYKTDFNLKCGTQVVQLDTKLNNFTKILL